LDRRSVVTAQRDVRPVEDRVDLLHRVVELAAAASWALFRYTCQLADGVVPPARPMRIARVVAEPSVFVVDESSKLMNRPPAVLFTTPLPSGPTSTAESAVPVRVGMLNV
jgi:hypothetical protein